MSVLEELQKEKYAAEQEMAKACHELSKAQSHFAKKRKKYEAAVNAYLQEAEKTNI